MIIPIKDIPIMPSLQDWYYLNTDIITGKKALPVRGDPVKPWTNTPRAEHSLECDRQTAIATHERAQVTILTARLVDEKRDHDLCEKRIWEEAKKKIDTLTTQLKKLEAFWEQSREVEKMNFELEWKLKHNDEPEIGKALEAFYNPANDNLTCADFLKRYL